MVNILNGTKLASQIEKELISKLSNESIKPKLSVLLIGNDKSSELYVGVKRKKCADIGIDFELKTFDSYKKEEVKKHIIKLNNDKTVTGIIVQLPLPEGQSPIELFSLICPTKDVDGVNPLNIGTSVLKDHTPTPPTAKGIISLMQNNGIKLKGEDIVIVGSSHIVGRPLARELINLEASVTILNIETKDIYKYIKNADIVISATGKKNLIKKEHVHKNMTIIDVGITKEEDKIYGDVDFENVSPIVKNITTHPGGVGPMTIISLMENVIFLYFENKGKGQN